MELSIPRNRSNDVPGAWSIVYGRRKVGKTYMLRTFTKWDLYVLMAREGRIWTEGGPLSGLDSIDAMVELVMGELGKGRTVVVDEFQRVPMDRLEEICMMHPKGTLVLSGSSMGVMGKVLAPGSPLLGRFREIRLGLVEPEDLFPAFPAGLPLDYAPYLSDPWTIPLLRGRDILRDLYSLMSDTTYTVPSLLGEVFHAEDRNLSEVFQGILGSIGAGRTKPAEMATLLHNRGVISKDGASQLSPYIKTMRTMGLLKEVGVYGRKRPLYRLGSPIFTAYYYLESKYGLERGLPPFREVRENLQKVHCKCMEEYLVDVMADHLGGYVRYSFEPEVDGIIVDRSERPRAVVEVKWGRVKSTDVDRFVDKAGGISDNRFLLTKTPVSFKGVKTLAPKDVIGLYGK
jgi:hypothetical protein